MSANRLLLAASAGVFATFLMDRVAVRLVQLGWVSPGRYSVVPRLLGRWVLGFTSGRFHRPRILEEPPLRTEAGIGWLCHYLIGMSLGLIYLALCRALSWDPRGALHAVGFGLLTTLLPWFVMFPALGFGWIGSRVPAGTRLRIFSPINHLVFGVGLAAFFRLFY